MKSILKQIIRIKNLVFYWLRFFPRKKKVLLYCVATQYEEHIINFYNIIKHSRINFYLYCPYDSKRLSSFIKKEKITRLNMTYGLITSLYFDLIASPDYYYRDKRQNMIPYFYLNHGTHLIARNNGNDTYAYSVMMPKTRPTLLFEANKEIAKAMQNEADKFGTKILWTGLNRFEKFFETFNEADFIRNKNLDPNKKTLLIISSWGLESIFSHYKFNDIINSIEKCLVSYNVIISLHPRFIAENADLYAKLTKLKLKGCFFREPEEDWLDFMKIASVIFSDYSSLTEIAIAMRKKLILSSYDKNTIWNKSLLSRSMQYLPILSDIKLLLCTVNRALITENSPELEKLGDEFKISEIENKNIIKIETYKILNINN